MVCPFAEFEEIFSTTHGAVFQCSRRNSYWLDFQGKATAFRVSDFLLFKKRIDAIDIESMLCESNRSHDFEIVMPYRTERCFLLTAMDVIHLRDILDGALFVIKLNSEVNRCLHAGALVAL